jgi:hypothetical protein
MAQYNQRAGALLHEMHANAVGVDETMHDLGHSDFLHQGTIGCKDSALPASE